MLNKLILTLCFAFITTAAYAETVYLSNPTTLEKQPITVEIADTPELRQQGLMFRTNLEQGHGMLFIWPEAKEINMWMKNTYIPLDMLFISNNYVVNFAENTVPLSKKLVSSEQPVDMVLELPAGSIQTYGINVGWTLDQWR